ncbi:hypothetical protein [Streptomyces katrae]|uniref:hypothetical protein n=1 Tax=Streptomyces katrae TaxID=68223 RepID=UPI000689B724|nr:hypothetical protein [Streptomyces katrae]
MYLDPGSGSDFHETREWWAYSGILNRSRVAGARGACQCGWRGAATYPIDWEAADAPGGYEPVIEGPQEDWEQHIDEVEARTVPLPTELAELLDRVGEHLNTRTGQAPVAALKAVSALETLTRQVARDAACMAKADDLSWNRSETLSG